jgi:hypothetical protein
MTNDNVPLCLQIITSTIKMFTFAANPTAKEGKYRFFYFNFNFLHPVVL